MNVDNVGSTDSEAFARYKIPRMSLHSVTTETLSVLHSENDQMAAIHPDDYFTSYKLIARDTVEEKILTLQQRKRELIQATLGGEEEFAAALSWNEIQELLS